jgi:hypothetical protein
VAADQEDDINSSSCAPATAAGPEKVPVNYFEMPNALVEELLHRCGAKDLSNEPNHLTTLYYCHSDNHPIKFNVPGSF